MKLSLIFMMWFCCHVIAAQENNTTKDFLNNYRKAVDPYHSLDTVRSVTLELIWLVRSVNPVAEQTQYRIQYISNDWQEDFDLVLNQGDWVKSKFDPALYVPGMQRIREHFLRLDTSDVEKLSFRILNDSITVIEKDLGPDFGRELTFDTRTMLPIGLNGYSLKHPSGKSVMHVKYGNYKWFSGLQMYTKLEMDFDNYSTFVTQTLVGIHFNLSPEQAMALKK